jgi:hypothetical protein
MNTNEDKEPLDPIDPEVDGGPKKYIISVSDEWSFD